MPIYRYLGKQVKESAETRAKASVFQGLDISNLDNESEALWYGNKAQSTNLTRVFVSIRPAISICISHCGCMTLSQLVRMRTAHFAVLYLHHRLKAEAEIEPKFYRCLQPPSFATHRVAVAFVYAATFWVCWLLQRYYKVLNCDCTLRFSWSLAILPVKVEGLVTCRCMSY